MNPFQKNSSKSCLLLPLLIHDPRHFVLLSVPGIGEYRQALEQAQCQIYECSESAGFIVDKTIGVVTDNL
jgi:hypothetical protein